MTEPDDLEATVRANVEAAGAHGAFDASLGSLAITLAAECARQPTAALGKTLAGVLKQLNDAAAAAPDPAFTDLLERLAAPLVKPTPADSDPDDGGIAPTVDYL